MERVGENKCRSRGAVFQEKEKEKQYGDEIGAEKSEKVNQPSSDSTPELRDFKAGCKIMEHVKKKGILEEILSENDNRLIREFFERGLVCPDEKIMDVLNEALDMCYGRLTTEEQSSLMADRETSALLQDKERTKSAMLDAILIHPDYNPNAWGGQKPLLNISDKVEKLNEIDQQLPIVEAKSSKLKECNESSTQSQNSTFDPCEEQPAHFSRVVAVKPVESEALKTAQLQGDEQVANSTQKLCKGTQRDGIKSVDLLKYSDKAKESREKQAEKDKKQKSAITPKEQPKVSSEKKQLDQDKKEKSVVAAKDKEQAKGSSKVKQPDKEKKQKSVMTPKEKDQAKGTSEAKQPEKDKKEKSAEASKQKENVESRESANKKSDDVKEKTAKTFKENEKAKTPTKRSEGGGSRKHRSRSSENPKTRCSLKEKRSSIDKSKALEKADAGSKHHASRKSRRESWAQHKSKSHKRRTHKSRSQSAVSRSSARKS